MKKTYKYVVLAVMLALVILRASIAFGSSEETYISDSEADSEVTVTDEIDEEPEITATPTVEISLDDGTVFSVLSDVESISVENSSLVKLLPEYSPAFTNLSGIELADGLEFTCEDVTALTDAFSGCEVTYNVTIDGSVISLDTKELDLSSISPDAITEAARELSKLPALESVNMTASDFSAEDEEALTQSKNGVVIKSDISLEDVGKLEAAAPLASFDYKFFLYGKVVSTADEKIEYEDINIGDDGVENVIRPILSDMGSLNYLKLDDCGTTSAVMAQLRDDFPEVKVVWRVYFSSYGDGPVGKVTYNCLTDTDHIWATGCVTDHFATELQYCTDVVYLDMGHNCITNIDFVNYMPKLEVALFSISWVEDISPLANCPNLEYLEIFTSKVTDITPLANCKSLKHLNISNLSEVTDITCLYDLDLDRLYCTMSYIPQEQQDEFKQLHPDCETEFGWVDPSKGYWRFIDGNYLNTDPSNRTERYAKLCEQIGYDDYANLSC